MLRVSFGRALAGSLVVVAATSCGTADAPNTDHVKPTCPKIVTDGGGGIVMPADGSQAPECQTSLCNYQSQEGCAADESCLPIVVAGAITPACEKVGTSTLGTACGTTACERGQTCELDGYCRKLCCAGDWTVCEAGESCFPGFAYTIDNTDTPTGAWVCYPVGTCSVLDPHPAACRADQDCKMVDSRGSEACVPKSGGELGEACSRASGRLCGAGLTCVGQPGSTTCRRLCRAEECGEPACLEGEGTCVHFDRDPPGVGECTPGW
jgi:hypothetical protein